MTSVRDRIENGTATLGVVGLGYVGLPLAVEAGKAGLTVVGLDVDERKVDAVSHGESYIKDVPAEEVAELVASGRLSATSDFSAVSRCDAVSICVPTPLDEHMAPDVSYIVAAGEAIAPHIKPGALVVLESTTYPGTTEEVLKPILERHGRTVGEDLFLAFSPERVDPGNPVYQTKNTPKVVGGVTAGCTERAVALYSRFIDTVVPVSTTRAAEMTKLLENIFRCVNIALVNEMLMLCDRMGVDIWEVIEAAKTKPFGFMAFYPGPGLGGHCIPIDPYYLSWKAREYDFHTEFIELSGKVNEQMPYYTLSRLMQALNTRKKALAGSRVLMLGVAYKADIDDVRESPATKIAKMIRDAGADLVYHDPYVPEFDGMRSIELTPETVASADIVLLITGHRNVDYAMVVEHAQLILDTRNAFAGFDSEKVVRL